MSTPVLSLVPAGKPHHVPTPRRKAKRLRTNAVVTIVTTTGATLHAKLLSRSRGYLVLRETR